MFAILVIERADPAGRECELCRVGANPKPIAAAALKKKAAFTDMGKKISKPMYSSVRIKELP